VQIDAGALARMTPLGGFDFEISSTEPPTEQMRICRDEELPGAIFSEVHK
jgi:hypothetical protein